mgnify:CR=1 FL=1
MKQKHLPLILVALMALTSIAVGCGSDDPDDVTPVTPPDSSSTDTIPEDTIPEDTVPEDTIVISVDSTIYVKWTGTSASVEVDEQLADQITYEINGANVVLTNSNTTDEFLFVLSGTTADGSFTYNGEYKTSFTFDGLDITSATGGAVNIQCGKRIKLKLEDGSTNKLEDAASSEQKAALNCQGHLEISGGGSLSIKGNARHGLRSKEYLELKPSTGEITVSAASDGIHCGEFFEMNGGTVVISDVGADGLQVETDATSEEKLNGQFIMTGGSLNVTLSAEDAKGIRLDDDASDTSIVPHMQILGGTVTVNLTSTANGSKAIASDGNLTIGSQTTEPTVDITVAGNVFTDPTTAEDNRATGIKADLTLTIAGGTTTVNATGTKSRGVRATTLTATGGTLTVTNTGAKSQGIKLDNTFVPGQGGTVYGSFKY